LTGLSGCFDHVAYGLTAAFEIQRVTAVGKLNVVGDEVVCAAIAALAFVF
jgi:hypothetical protein